MAHDFDRFPELTNSQLDFYYFDSPHKQIFEDFFAVVTKVHDGDTIKVKWRERDFEFPVRFSNIAAPELKDEGGKDAQSWLETLILDKEVYIKVNKANRVEKWGRLLGKIVFQGMDVGEQEINLGISKPWNLRHDGSFRNDIPKKVIP